MRLGSKPLEAVGWGAGQARGSREGGPGDRDERAAPPARPGRLSAISGFVRGNISTAGTSAGAVPRAAATNADIGVVSPARGYLHAITVAITNTAGGTSYTGQIYVNAAATGILVTLDATTLTGVGRAAAPFPVNSGDIIQVYDIRVGALNSRAAEFVVWGAFEED